MENWWLEINPQAEFARTPMSGGSQLKIGWGMAGDIVCNDPDFPFHVEAKNQEAWKLVHLLEDKGKVLNDWWWQCISDCPANKIPLLMFTKNYRPDYCMTYMIPSLLSLFVEKEISFMVNYEPFEVEDVSDLKFQSEDDDIYPLVIFYADSLYETKPRYWLDIVKQKG